MPENPKMAGHKAQLQRHVNEHAAYGGHDGHGGPQKPKFKPLRIPAGIRTGAILAGGSPAQNVVPQTGPASAGGSMSGPVGSGGSSGAGN